jgi:hypothetical protein
MTTPLAAEVLGVGNATATAQAQLKALSAAIALVSTNVNGSTGTIDLSNAFIANINALSSILQYYQVAFANLNGNATS